MKPRYVTRWGKLYEVVKVQTTRNSGLGGGEIATYWLQDTTEAEGYEEPFSVNQAQFNEYKPVNPDEEKVDIEAEAAKLRADLDRWAEEAPWWAKT